MRRAAVPWVVAAALALVLACAFGFTYPGTNQNAYLVHGLVLHDPSLLPNDWYVREATDYHHTFSVVVAALFALRDGPEPFVVLDLILVVIGALGWFALLRRAFGPLVGLVCYGAWLGLGALTLTSDVMESYFFGGYLQPSSIGIAGYLWALALFADASAMDERQPRRRRLLASGAALAVSGVFHVNYLLLGIATLGLALVGLYRGRVWQRDFWLAVAAHLALPALVVLWSAPDLLEATRGPTAEALPILFNIRAPHHFHPTLEALAPFFAWQLAAWVVVLAHRTSTAVVPAVLVRLLAAVGGFVMVASVFSVVFKVPQATQLFPWRMAPVATALALVIVVGTALRGAEPAAVFQEPRVTLARIGSFVAAATLGLYGAKVATWHADRARVYLGALALALVVVVVLARIAAARGRAALRPVLATGVVAVVVLGGAWVAVRDVPLHIQGPPSSRAAVAAWAARTTPVDAVFATPPNIEDFRLLSRRSLVVDWKSAGMLPKDLVAWARRIEDVSGARLRSHKRARTGYAAMDETRARALVARYGVDYFVFDKKVAPAPTWSAPVYANGRFAVLPAPVEGETAQP